MVIDIIIIYFFIGFLLYAFFAGNVVLGTIDFILIVFLWPIVLVMFVVGFVYALSETRFNLFR